MKVIWLTSAIYLGSGFSMLFSATDYMDFVGYLCF